MVTGLAWAAIGATALLAIYTYLGYPLILRVLAAARRTTPAPTLPEVELPHISISLPVFNEEHQIAETLESLLALDYPKDRRQIVVVSDASTDRTDEIVLSYAHRGVELVRQPVRSGKTAAEELARRSLSGEVIVNTDASIRIHRNSLRQLLTPFSDPTVGLASGRDVSVGRSEGDVSGGEAGYVGYEMWIRDLETQVSGIVGASGCLYAIRPEIHRLPLPHSLSRDFAAALNTRELGFRAVSVHSATCSVPRTTSLRKEYRRKVRTMARGMETLWYKRALLSPLRHGIFAWMLFSHKVCRWLLPWFGIVGLVGLAFLAGTHAWARAAVMAVLVVLAVAAIGWLSDDRPVPRMVALATFAVLGNVACVHAGLRALLGDREPIWEPTRRTS